MRRIEPLRTVSFVLAPRQTHDKTLHMGKAEEREDKGDMKEAERKCNARG
jgi:hypothetical protein